jgi:hypothetical protein
MREEEPGVVPGNAWIEREPEALEEPLVPGDHGAGPWWTMLSSMAVATRVQPPPTPPVEHIRRLVEANRVPEARGYAEEQVG